MRLHLVENEDQATLCGKSMDDVVDCITVEYYVDHYTKGTEAEMFVHARSAMVLVRLVLSVLEVNIPETEPADSDSPMCEECSGYAGLDILGRYAADLDSDL